jgi:tetratricopeptide (TPR) repeat protein
MRQPTADARFPGYLARVLNGNAPVGTSFQVAPGVLVTAFHVISDLGAGAEGQEVELDPMTGGHPRRAVVRSVAPDFDLAVLTCSDPLPASTARLVAIDPTAVGTEVAIQGVPSVEDPDHTYEHLSARGTVEGPVTRDGIPILRVRSDSVLPGMSGAPVRRRSDDAILGVVSARYNSVNGWLRDSVWVIPTELLGPLIDDIAEAAVVSETPPTSLDLVLRVSRDEVRLSGMGVDVTQRAQGVTIGLDRAVAEARRVRARAVKAIQEEDPTASAATALGRAGSLLAESFVPESLAGALASSLEQAVQGHAALRLGIEAGDDLARLPWEAIPGPSGTGPLALHPMVTLYRRTPAAAVRPIPGPLRVLVAIASPDEGGGPVLDYEAELRNVIRAVRAARQDGGYVHVVEFATTDAIRHALNQEQFHVLHLSGHGSPGIFVFEDETGNARTLDADRFIDEAIPPGAMPPLVVLAACFTNVGAANGAPAFATTLLQRGVSVVVGTETSVSDRYATRLHARLYSELAGSAFPDVVRAVADARRAVDLELRNGDDRDRRLASLEEWATVSVMAPEGSVRLFDPAERAAVGGVGDDALSLPGIVSRSSADIVGRRRERRRWPTELLERPEVGMVLTGIGGVGKTTLAMEIARQVSVIDSKCIVVGLYGQLAADGILRAVTRAITLARLKVGVADDELTPVLDAVANRVDLPAVDRLALLREVVFPVHPVMVMLDNFEDNLVPLDGGHQVIEGLAEFLADWVDTPGSSRLLITSRFGFSLPRDAERALRFSPLGPLSLAETLKLVWALPHLEHLSEDDLEQLWRRVGGHPRSLEYVDAVLGGGEARFVDVTRRLTDALENRLGKDQTSSYLADRVELDAAITETVTLAADDVLLDDLVTRLSETPGAEALLLGASVYRERVDDNALLFQVGTADEQAAFVPDRSAIAAELDRVLTNHGFTAGGQLDPTTLPEPLRSEALALLVEAAVPPRPPRRFDSDLASQVEACRASSLLVTNMASNTPTVFVQRWSAEGIVRRWERLGRTDEVTAAHRRAAEYWHWRVEVWSQDRAAVVHDLLEARFHHLEAGEIEEAERVTELACSRLHDSGAWEQEEALVVDMLHRLGEHPRRVTLLHQLGVLAQGRGDYGEAERFYRQSLEIAKRLDDQVGMGANYHQLGVLAQDRGDYEEAERGYRQSLEIAERLGNPTTMASGYHQLGILAQSRGDYEEAERRYRQSLEIEERLGNQAGMGESYHQLGILAQARGNYDEAERRYRQALEIAERLGNPTTMALSYGQLGILAQSRGDYDEAERRYRQSFEIAERLGNQAGMGGMYHQLGILAQRRGDYDEAERRYRQALEIMERLGNQGGMATGYGQLGVLAQDRGDYDEAERRYRQALEIMERLGNQADMATGYSLLGFLRLDQEKAEEAISFHLQALSIRMRLRASGAMVSLRALVELRTRLGKARFDKIASQSINTGSLNDLRAALDQIERGQSS